MFVSRNRRRLASMSETDAAMLNWSDLGVSELVPTGTVTLLLADVEGSTPLWETQPHEMTAAFANLDRVLAEIVPSHGGVRPIEQGEGTASSSPSDVRATRSHAHWSCSAHHWPRSVCASVCTPARSNCATSPTTSGRRSTARHAFAIWRTADRRCYPAPQRIWCAIGFPRMRG